MNDKFLDLYRLLVELQENKKVPKKYTKELEKNICFVRGIIEEPTKFTNKHKKILVLVIAFVLEVLNTS